MNIVVAGSREAVVMVEGGAEFVPEEDIADAIMFAHKAIVPVVDAQDELQKLVANTKEAPPEVVIDQTLVDRISDLAHAEMQRSNDRCGKARKAGPKKRAQDACKGRTRLQTMKAGKKKSRQPSTSLKKR